MGKARGIRDDGISHEGRLVPVAGDASRDVQGVILPMRARRRSQPFTCLDTRPPAAKEDLLDALASFGDLAALEGVDAGHEARVLDHEGHKLGGVASDVEELELILLDKGLKGRMSGDAHAVAVGIFEDLSQGDEGLDVTPRSNNLDDDIELRRGRLSRLATKARRDVGGRECRLRVDLELARESRGEEVGEAPVLRVDADIDSSVVYESSVRPPPRVWRGNIPVTAAPAEMPGWENWTWSCWSP